MFVPHRFVEILEILLSPIAAIRGESVRAGMDPGVGSRKIIAYFWRRFVLVDQQRRRHPVAAMFADAIPVDMAVLRENENQRSPLVGEIGVVVGGGGPNEFFVAFVNPSTPLLR